MTAKTFVLGSLDAVAAAVGYIQGQPSAPTLEVIVREHKSDRSTAQNALYWLWVTVLAGEHGLTKEDVHADLKKRLLLPIYERDDLGYGAMVQAVRKVHTEGYREDAQALADEIVRLTSTTRANVDQFTEYLNEIEKDSVGKGIYLPHPEDRYREAMGV